MTRRRADKAPQVTDGPLRLVSARLQRHPRRPGLLQLHLGLGGLPAGVGQLLLAGGQLLLQLAGGGLGLLQLAAEALLLHTGTVLCLHIQGTTTGIGTSRIGPHDSMTTVHIQG
jgi:hypothetical protein